LGRGGGEPQHTHPAQLRALQRLIQNGNVGTLVFEPVTNRRTNNVTGFVVGVYDIRTMMDMLMTNRYIRLNGLRYSWRAFPCNGK
jgi:hypothetical protein